MVNDVVQSTCELLEQVGGRLSHVEEGMADLKGRVSGLGIGLGLARQDIGVMLRHIPQQSLHTAMSNTRLDRMEHRLGGIEERMDRMDQRSSRIEVRLDRIERRLDLTDA